MGIKHLSRFLRKNCKNIVNEITFNMLSGKHIVVDTSIYIHKGKSTKSLIEYMTSLCSLFYTNNIRATFIFDGMPPREKRQELENRRKQAKIAKEQYNTLKSELTSMINGANESGKRIDCHDKQDIEIEMEILRRQFAKITKNELKITKELIRSYGMKCMTAHGEADNLCAYMVNHGYADICMSEDTDLFVYQCPRVIRYISILRNTCCYYEFNKICDELGLTNKQFVTLCQCSANDYEPNQPYIENVYQLYKSQNVNLCPNKKVTNGYYIDESDMYALVERKLAIPQESNLPRLHEIMETDGFVFVPT